MTAQRQSLKMHALERFGEADMPTTGPSIGVTRPGWVARRHLLFEPRGGEWTWLWSI